MKQILMASPVRLTGDNIVKAIAQWSELRNTLLDLGFDVIVMPELPSGDIFISGAGLIYKNDFIESRHDFAERGKDVSFISSWFNEHRFDVQSDSSFNLDTDNVIFSSDRQHLWFGIHNLNQDIQSKRILDDVFDRYEDLIIRPLEIEKQFRLRDVFCPLASGELLWYPQAFSTHSKMVIDSWYEGKMIEVSSVDVVLNAACNSISNCDTIIMPLISDELHATLLKRGYDVVQVDVSELIKRGGGCNCLTLEVTE